VDRLLIHGILHLLGYDHEGSSKQALRMTREENRLMTLMMEE
jgi:ssRNA-specific RNase YbeY (16S rRNA maturation enzyme)